MSAVSAVSAVSATMQALVVLEPNRLEIQEAPVPTPGPNEVLARVRAVSICGTDAHLIRGDYPGFWPPRFPFVPGHEWAGEIAALGPGAERFGWAVGDRVAGRGPGGRHLPRRLRRVPRGHALLLPARPARVAQARPAATSSARLRRARRIRSSCSSNHAPW